MSINIHTYAEYRRDGRYVLLGRFHPGEDDVVLDLLAGVHTDDAALFPVRDLPPDVTFETWLEHMRSYKDELSPEELGRVKMGRIVGADLSGLVTPDGSLFSKSWLNADELGAVIAKAEEKGGARRKWKALAILLQNLPSGRLVFSFSR